MKDILIVGYGNVGRNLRREWAGLNIDVFDKYKPAENTKRDIHYDICVVCVDTPYVSADNVCDIKEVRNAINDNDASVYVIKSTVLPGTTELLCAETGKTILFSPEYYGTTHFTNNYCFDFTILGGDREAAKAVAQVLQAVYDGRHRFFFTNAKTAELCKYMENAFLATKVSFCQEFFEIAEKIGVDYEELRELFVADPRVDNSQTYVFRDHPYWKSHCYDKDIPAIAETYDAKLLKAVIEFNERQKERYVH